jgi:hypothetical protein
VYRLVYSPSGEGVGGEEGHGWQLSSWFVVLAKLLKRHEGVPHYSLLQRRKSFSRELDQINAIHGYCMVRCQYIFLSFAVVAGAQLFFSLFF